MKKYIMSLLLTIIIFISTVSTVGAVPQTVTFNSRKLSGVNIHSGSSSDYKTVTSGDTTIIGLCLSKTRKSPKNGATLVYKETITDPGYIYIFENGYAGIWNVSLLGNGLTNDQRFYATQLAIWMYQGKLEASALDKTHPENTAAIKLYEEAKKAQVVKKYIDIKSNDTTMFSDETYYKSTLMTVSGTGFTNFSVHLINGTDYAEIVTTSGKVYKTGATMTAGTNFYIRIPKDKIEKDVQITVQVNATAKVNKVYQYTTNDSAYQDVGIMMADTQKITDGIKIDLVKDKTYKVNIIKKDAATDEPLAGATLVLKDSKGQVIDTWVSTTKPHTIDELESGVYSITETKAPNGYVLNTKPINFTLVGGRDNEKTVYIYNTKEEVKTGAVKISKQDITTKKELPGATLTIKNANGEVVATWVSTNKPHYVTGLTPGKYTLIETTSPDGYGLSDEIIEFSIDENGKPSSELVIMYNSPIPVTADINLTLLFMGFVGTVALGIFSIYKLAKQQ